MNKIIKLYDFSAGTAALVISAYFCMIGVLAGASAGASNPLPYLAILVVLVLTFAAICLYYVGLPVMLDQNSVRRGKVCMDKDAVKCTVFYSRRYREMNVRFEDGKSVLTVQATKRNLAIAEAWLGHALEVPEKPGIFQK